MQTFKISLKLFLLVRPMDDAVKIVQKPKSLFAVRLFIE